MGWIRPLQGGGSGGGGGGGGAGVGVVVNADLATQANVTLTAGASPSDVDGVAVTTGMIILVWNQGSQPENGLYYVQDAGTGVDDGTWVRLPAMSTGSQLASLALVKVREGGLVSGGDEYIPGTVPPYVIGVTPITFQLYPIGSAGGGQAYFTWGNGDLGTTVTPRYLAPGFDPGLAQTTPLVFVVPTAKTIHKLNVLQPIAGVGGDVVYTLYVNGVASVLTATLLASAASGSDLVNNVAAPAGATLALVVTKAGAITTSPGNVEVSVEVF